MTKWYDTANCYQQKMMIDPDLLSKQAGYIHYLVQIVQFTINLDQFFSIYTIDRGTYNRFELISQS